MSEKMSEKTLHNTNVDGAHKNVHDLVVFGTGDTFSLWLKASSQNEGWMKTTKVANIPGGCLVQTETQQRNPDGSYALSQALVFVPGAQLDTRTDPLHPALEALPVRLPPKHRSGA